MCRTDCNHSFLYCELWHTIFGLVTILMGVRSELVGMEYVPFVVPCVGLVEFAEVVLVDHLCSADQQVPNQFVVEVPIVE